MEKKILEYEKYIAKETEGEVNSDRKAVLKELHSEMMKYFEYERLIHLIVTLFFSLLAIVTVAITAWMISSYGLMIEMIPLYLITLILVVLTAFYIRHYYFLENHIQGLYKYAKKIFN